MVVGQYNESFYPVLDGVVTTVSNYARWLNEKHCSCYVVTPEVPRYADNHVFEVIRYKSLPVVGRRPYRTGFPTMDNRFRKWHNRQPVDLVHAHSPFFAGHEALRIARKRDIPIVATFHSKFYDDFLQATRSKLISKGLLDYVIRFFKNCDVVWTVNEGTACTLYEYGYRGPFEIVPNGVDFPVPSAGQTLCAHRFRAVYQLEEHIPVFLFVGQHIWQKNLRTLLRAAALYKQTGAPFRLVMVGEGTAKPEIQALADTLNLREQVLFTGAIFDRILLAEAYLSAELFVFPSVYDNAPLVVREAALFGLPPVLIRGSNAAEGVTHGENGFLAEDTPEDIARVITEAMSDETRRRAAGKRAKATLPISWEDIVARVYEKYVDIVKHYPGTKTRREKSARGRMDN